MCDCRVEYSVRFCSRDLANDDERACIYLSSRATSYGYISGNGWNKTCVIYVPPIIEFMRSPFITHTLSSRSPPVTHCYLYGNIRAVVHYVFPFFALLLFFWFFLYYSFGMFLERSSRNLRFAHMMLASTHAAQLHLETRTLCGIYAHFKYMPVHEWSNFALSRECFVITR